MAGIDPGTPDLIILHSETHCLTIWSVYEGLPMKPFCPFSSARRADLAIGFIVLGVFLDYTRLLFGGK